MKRLLLLFCLLGIVGVAGAELIVNGGFEDSDTDMSPWMTWGSGGGATWAQYFPTLQTSGGAGDVTGNPGGDNWLALDVIHSWATWGWGFNVAFQGKTTDGQAAIPVTGGQPLTLFADFKSFTVTEVLIGWEWRNEFGIIADFNGDGMFNDWDKQNIYMTIVPDGTWQTVSSSVIVPEIPGVDEVTLVFGGAGFGQDLGLDNVRGIPEPMSIALLGLGGLFLRRKR
jgi:hypothetical protein